MLFGVRGGSGGGRNLPLIFSFAWVFLIFFVEVRSGFGIIQNLFLTKDNMRRDKRTEFGYKTKGMSMDKTPGTS